MLTQVSVDKIMELVIFLLGFYLRNFPFTKMIENLLFNFFVCQLYNQRNYSRIFFLQKNVKHDIFDKFGFVIIFLLQSSFFKFFFLIFMFFFFGKMSRTFQNLILNRFHI